MKLAKQGMPVLVALNAVMEFHGKDYCFPAQRTLCQRLAGWYSVEISRRQLNRILAAMVQGGLIHRTRRHVHHKRRGMLFRSTLYHITVRGWRLMYLWGCIRKERFLEMLGKVKQTFSREKKPPEASRSSRGLDALSDILKGFKSVFW